jgi:FKBP-type peptidyl-prolyl cis-trans isomerase FkpA
MKLTFRLLSAVLSLAILIQASGCKQSKFDGYDVSETGLNYKFYKQNKDGKKPKVGEILEFDMIYKTDKDSTLFSSVEMGQPVMLPLEVPSFVGGIEEGFAMMAEGDSASFIVPSDSLFKKTFKSELPAFIKAGSYIKFYLKLNKVMDKAALEEERKKEAERKQEEMEVKQKEEMEILEQYLKDNKITTPARESGLIYIETQKGSGAQPQNGKKVKVNYTGRLLDGKIFDSSIEALAKEGGVYNEQRPYEPIEFQLGTGQVIPGWDEGIALMKKGGKAKLIIPSKLAYRNYNQGPIPPYSTLVFEVELVGVE